MNEHKTFYYYLVELLKFIVFMSALAWLCSCSTSKQKTVKALQQVKFDIDLLAGELAHIDKQINSDQFMNMAYTDKTPLNKQRAAQLTQQYNNLYYARTMVNYKLIMLKVKYDSINLELNK